MPSFWNSSCAAPRLSACARSLRAPSSSACRNRPHSSCMFFMPPSSSPGGSADSGSGGDLGDTCCLRPLPFCEEQTTRLFQERLVTGPSSSAWRRRVQPLLPGLVGTASLAVLCNAILELGQLVDVDGYPWLFKTPAFAALFLLGCLVLWPLVGLVYAVVGRLSVTTALLVSATAVVAFA